MLDVKKMLMKLSDLVGGDSRWTNLNGNVWYKKRCDIVYIRLTNGNSVQLTKTGTTLGTLPTGYRPDYQYDMAGTALGGSESVFFRVDTNGKITGFASATTSYWSGTVCFPMKIGGGYCVKAVFSRLCAPFHLKGGALNA